MGFTYTQEQCKVINLRERGILVSAAAGSGKTTVLVERIIRMICDESKPVDIDRLLVLTFTNAAAGEMRERISNAINEELKKHPENEHLQRQATLLHNALITTIHSFCLFLLKNNFNDIGLDPGFRVADEGELKLLNEEVLGNLLEELFQSDKVPGFIQLADRFITGNSMKGLTDVIFDAYHYSMSYPFAKDWLLERKKDYSVQNEQELQNTNWAQLLIASAHRNIEESIQLTECSLKLCEESDGPYMYATAFLNDLEVLNRGKKCESLGDWYKYFNEIKFMTLTSKKDESVNPEKKEQAKGIRDLVKSNIKDFGKKYFSLEPSSVVTKMKENAKIIDSLIDTVLLFKEELDQKKREKKLIDFSDMEHLALQILLENKEGFYVPTRTAKDYQTYFKEIMIDEYQDSNMVQEWILKSISGEEMENYNRFMVGDVKQSIYKFRLACPELFMEKYDTYGKEDGKKQRIDLSKNYRSRSEIIDSVNYIFEKIMAKDLGNVSYGEENALFAAADYKECISDNTTQFLLIEKDEESKLSKQEQEAEAVAGEIKKIVGSFEITDKETKKMRKASYRDIVILLRTTSGWDEEFKRILEKEGIPVYITSKTGYFSSNEIRTVMNFLRIMDNPKQDIPLFGTLTSEFGQFSEDEVAIIRTLDTGNLYGCLEKCAKADISEEQKKLLKEIELPIEKSVIFLERLNKYRDMVPYQPIHKLLRQLFLETGYLYEVASKPNGEQKKANVNMFLEKAEKFERSSYRGLFHFIRYMEQIKNYDVDYGEAATLDENADVVRIMSIHKSKGLEFPICFVSGLSKKFNMTDVRDSVIFDTNYGIGLDYVNIEKRVKYSDVRKKVLSEKLRQDNLAEEIRVLYVALTRAKEKLIMSALIDDFSKVTSSLSWHKIFLAASGVKEKERIPLYLRLRASSYLDLLYDSFLYQQQFADALKEYGYSTEYIDKNAPSFSVTCIKKEDIAKDKVEEGICLISRKESLLYEMENTQNLKEMSDALKEQLTFTYAHQNMQKLYTKTTVSELKIAAIHSGLEKENRQEEAVAMFPDPEIKQIVPNFAKKKEKVSGTQRGSAYHRVMELLDFSCTANCLSKEEQFGAITEQMQQFLVCGQMLEEEIHLIDVNKICVFLQTSLAERMKRAKQLDNLYREQPFVLGVEAFRLSEEFPHGETVLIQGIIDVYFIEDNEIVLMDYKTDVVKEAKELIDRYKTQLVYYTEALERITGLKVKEKLIYSFTLQQTISL